MLKFYILKFENFDFAFQNLVSLAKSNNRLVLNVMWHVIMLTCFFFFCQINPYTEPFCPKLTTHTADLIWHHFMAIPKLKTPWTAHFPNPSFYKFWQRSIFFFSPSTPIESQIGIILSIYFSTESLIPISISSSQLYFSFF